MNISIFSAVFLLLGLAAFGTACGRETTSDESTQGDPPVIAAETKVATFAGGCFWCMESPFEKLDGVLRVTAGYTGGETRKPTYEEVSSGKTGHLEAD